MDDKEYKKKKSKKLLLLLLVIFTISIGFALLSTTLFINGTSTIKGNTWDIRWDSNSIAVTAGSVSAPDPTVTENDTKVSFEVDLELPGDFYEFTVDAINTGTIDGMISNIESSIKDGTGAPATLPSYIHFSVTYDDGALIAKNQLLPKRVDAQTPTREKYKVRIEYDREETTVPANDLSFTVTYDVTYQQATGDAVERNVCVSETSSESNFAFDSATGTITGFKTGLQNPPTSIVIPCKIDGVTVTAIGNNAFSGRSLTSVKLAPTIVTIGREAFAADAITELVIPGSVKTVERLAFTSNQIEKLTIDNGVEEIAYQAFAANNISKLVLPQSMRTIGDDAFAANSLEKITIEGPITSIGTKAFYVNADEAGVRPSNHDLTKIINQSGNAYDWDKIINNSTQGNYTFATGDVTTVRNTIVSVVSQ